MDWFNGCIGELRGDWTNFVISNFVKGQAEGETTSKGTGIT